MLGSMSDAYVSVYGHDSDVEELASGRVEMAETVSVEVDQPVGPGPGGALVEGTKRRRTLPVLLKPQKENAVAEPYHAPRPVAVPTTPPSDDTPGGEPADGQEPLVPTSQAAVGETLGELAREGARRMLERALHSEVDGYLGRRRYDRADDDFAGYRNGYARDREISVGTWAPSTRPPRMERSESRFGPRSP